MIVLLRDPLSRYESNFRMKVRLKTVNTKLSSKISTLITTELQSLYKSFIHRNVSTNHLPESVNMLLCLYSPARNCIYEGLYYVHLHNWLCNFPAEEFQTSSQCIFSQVIEFVGLKPLDVGILNTVTKVKYNYGGKVEAEPDFRVLSQTLECWAQWTRRSCRKFTNHSTRNCLIYWNGIMSVGMTNELPVANYWCEYILFNVWLFNYWHEYISQ